MERVAQVLKYCRDWNTRARNAHIAMMVVKAIVTTISVHQLASAKNGIPEILAGIIPYAERHFDRLDRLHSNSYLIDFALTGLGALDASDNSESEQEFADWEASSKLVLPPKFVDGRIQVGGKTVIGKAKVSDDDDDDDDTSSHATNDEVVTIGGTSASESYSSESDGDKEMEDVDHHQGGDDGAGGDGTSSYSSSSDEDDGGNEQRSPDSS
jgi:U3 small nucleolar RNA-associated protein 13